MFSNTIITLIKPTYYPWDYIVLIQFSRPATQPQTQPVGHRRCTQPKAGPFLTKILLGLTSSFFRQVGREECFKSYNEINHCTSDNSTFLV